MNCPAFICDACRKQVVGDGNIIWAVRYVGEARQSSPVFVSHKFPCSRQVDALVKRHYPCGEGWSGLWEEASVFIGHLSNNLVHAFDDDPEGEYHEHALMLPRQLLPYRSAHRGSDS